MYTVSVSHEFTAWHYLIGGDWGPENELNAHPYKVEALLEGPGLDRHGYLVDIIAVEQALAAIDTRYAGNTLNELPEFEGLNPSVEHFARILWDFIAERIPTEPLASMTIRVWEGENAWASYRREIRR